MVVQLYNIDVLPRREISAALLKHTCVTRLIKMNNKFGEIELSKNIELHD